MAKKSSASPQREELRRMTSEDIKSRKWTKGENTAVRHAAKMQEAADDSEIDFRDIPHLTKEQVSQFVRLRNVRRKVPVSLRLDPQVLEWLKSKGEGHLTRINDILRNFDGGGAGGWIALANV